MGKILRLASGALGSLRAGRTQFGHIASCLDDPILGRHPLGGIELVEDVRVDVQRHRRRVPGLARDLYHATPFVDQQRDDEPDQV